MLTNSYLVHTYLIFWLPSLTVKQVDVWPWIYSDSKSGLILTATLILAPPPFLEELTDFDREGAENMDYEQFLENVIPRSRSIIYMMRDRVPNPYNFHSMISFFEPFLIYPDNITYSAKTLNDKRTGAMDVKQGGSYQEIRFHVK